MADVMASPVLKARRIALKLRRDSLPLNILKPLEDLDHKKLCHIMDDKLYVQQADLFFDTVRQEERVNQLGDENV